MMATCSVDKTVTLWDTYHIPDNSTARPPKACGNKDMNVGKLYSVNFYPSAPWLLGCAGGNKELAIWDMTREATIQKRFAERIGREPAIDTLDSNDIDQKEAFDEMMSAQKLRDEPYKENVSTKKKKSGSKKKKVHKIRR